MRIRTPTSASGKTQAIDLFTTPITWSDMAPSDRPVELEIGSGKGLFLQTSASARPGVHFVGIELAAKFANRAAQRIAKHNLTNVVVLRGDAKVLLNDIVPTQALTGIHVYFPDPWWRNKHKKRRILNEQSLAHIVPRAATARRIPLLDRCTGLLRSSMHTGHAADTFERSLLRARTPGAARTRLHDTF